MTSDDQQPPSALPEGSGRRRSRARQEHIEPFVYSYTHRYHSSELFCRLESEPSQGLLYHQPPSRRYLSHQIFKETEDLQRRLELLSHTLRDLRAHERSRSQVYLDPFEVNGYSY